MYTLCCACRHILQCFGLLLGISLDMFPCVTLVCLCLFVCALMHTSVVFRQELPFVLWNLLAFSAFFFSCFFSVTKPRRTVRGMLVPGTWPATERFLNVCSWGTLPKIGIRIKCCKPVEVKQWECF